MHFYQRNKKFNIPKENVVGISIPKDKEICIPRDKGFSISKNKEISITTG